MSTNSKLTPKLRFPAFREPWEEKAVGDYLIESRIPGGDGYVAKKITVKLWGKGVYEKVESLKGSENTQYYKRRGGQFIYSKLDFLNQAFGIIPQHLDGFESTVDLPCFDVSDGLDPRFLLEYVQRPNYYKKHGDMADGGRKAKRIQVESFLSFPVAVPSPAEQQKIADCLSSLDELIAAEGRKLQSLRACKKGLMQQLFPRDGESTPQLRFPEFRKAGEWVEAKLDDLAKRRTGHTPNKANPAYYNGGIKWVSLADSKRLDKGLISQTEIEISQEGIENSSAVLHPAGSVILSRDAGVGKSAVTALPMAVSQHFIVWICDSDKLSNWFLYFVLQKLKPLFEQIATGSTIKTIGMPFFTAMQIIVPSPPEQQRIAACLSSLDEQIAVQSRKIESLKQHKKGLMQQLFPSASEVEA